MRGFAMGRKALRFHEFLSRVGTGKALVQCHKGDVIFTQGDTADAVFFIHNGRVKLTVVSKRGKEAVVALLEAGSFFGEGCLNGQSRRLATAAALTRGRSCASQEKRCSECCKPSQPLPLGSCRTSSNGTVALKRTWWTTSSTPARNGWLGCSSCWPHFGKDHAPEPILPKISQEILAEMVGTTRSRVSFFMNKFRKLGFIHYNDTLEIHNSLLNVVLHD